MTQEEKSLLLKDLSARLHHGVKVSFQGQICTIDTASCDATLLLKGKDGYVPNIEEGLFIDIDRIKPYLRPMSSMTEEEAREYANCGNIIANSPQNNYLIPNPNSIDWLNKNHFDYRGLIEKGLALEAPEDMYNIKEQ